MTTQTTTIRLRERGQLTIPQNIREGLAAEQGDMLSVVQVDDLLLLTPKQLQTPRLTEAFTAVMEQEGVTLADLLTGLIAERQATYDARRKESDSA